MTKIKYRPEIDGLRALAVVMVILFHMNDAILPAGFIGVDVFFVISGFLISSLIINDLNRKTFSIANFYSRRLKRILPVFYVMLSVTTLFSYLLFRPQDIKSFNLAVKNIIVFLGNHHFKNSGDYFSLASSEIPLLHTWSLAVEEQFYFIWPFVSILLFKFPYKRLIFILPLIGAVFSFLGAEYLLVIKHKAAFSYYSLLTRSGELMVGYLTAVLYGPPFNEKIKSTLPFISYLGVTFIGLTLLFLNKTSTFPGINALPVCVGTAMIIYGLQKNTLLYKILSTDLLVFVGKLSYSLYLWHWPVLAFMRYVHGDYTLPFSWLLVFMFITFGLSLLSYFFIENKTRYLKQGFKASFLLFYVFPSLFVCLLIKGLNRTPLNYEDPLPPLYTIYGGDDLCHGKINDKCIRGDKTKNPRILIVGDSHTAHYTYFFDELGKKYGWSAKVLSSSSCSPVFNYNESLLPEWAHEGCKNLKDHFWSHYKDYDIIVLSSRWDFHLGLSNCKGHDPDFLEKLEKTLDRLSGKVQHIYVLSQIPLLFNHPFRLKKFMALKFPMTLYGHSDHSNTANKVIKAIVLKYPNVTFLETTPYFRFFDKGFLFHNKPTYMDQTHLNQYGAETLAHLFKNNPFDLKSLEK